MKLRDIEKKIYELLGVNIFRKYFLLSLDKLLKPFGGVPNYRIKNKTINEIKEYKSIAKAFALGHFILIILVSGGYYFFNIITESKLIEHLIFNQYCIMTQRYTCIRINEILEKQKKLEKKKKLRKKEEDQKNEEKILNHNLSSSYQPKKLKEQENHKSSIESYYWEKYFESLEQQDSSLNNDFIKVLKK